MIFDDVGMFMDKKLADIVKLKSERKMKMKKKTGLFPQYLHCCLRSHSVLKQ